jgi:hypothetical protein
VGDPVFLEAAILILTVASAPVTTNPLPAFQTVSTVLEPSNLYAQQTVETVEQELKTKYSPG